jgi:hypothetical protein
VIAVDVDLEQSRRSVPGSARGSRIGAFEAKRPQIELIDEDINDADRAVIVDPVIESFGEQNALCSILPFDVPSHRSLPPV